MALTGPTKDWLRHFFIEITIESWDEVRVLADRMPGWLWRGQMDRKWGLSTSLQRTQSPKCTWSVLYDKESRILRNFRRRSSQYLSNPPAADELLEWIALLQHHGAPTRMLDFTHSLYVAAFFAMEYATDDAAIWGVDHRLLIFATEQVTGVKMHVDSNERINDKHIQVVNEFLNDHKKARKLVLNVEPYRRSKRLSAQQGIFLCPCDLEATFEENLCTTFEAPFTSLTSESAEHLRATDLGIEISSQTAIIKIILPRRIHDDGMLDLHRMNLTAETLFPGLDGFTRSLRIHTRYNLS